MPGPGPGSARPQVRTRFRSLTSQSLQHPGASRSSLLATVRETPAQRVRKLRAVLPSFTEGLHCGADGASANMASMASPPHLHRGAPSRPFLAVRTAGVMAPPACGAPETLRDARGSAQPKPNVSRMAASSSGRSPCTEWPASSTVTTSAAGSRRWSSAAPSSRTIDPLAPPRTKR